MFPFRPPSTTLRHGLKTINIGSLLKNRVPLKSNYNIFAGQVGFVAGDRIYTAHLGIGQFNDKYLDEILPEAPKLLIEIMSHNTYHGEGAALFRVKVNAALKYGSDTVWVVHPGVKDKPTGVQVMTESYDPSMSFVKDSEILNDAGIGLNILAKELLDE
eukprot:TRINITY_DN18619_c0_g1_i2.p1 TRINITY_DN18619_c0_g1~~TRINITY_DN18619_c0_g1_i2.p1  ORF type:complete len:159 (-),score=7.52 TRINITY_DN18619_c0_g1_i2:121-597(-)